VNVPVLLLVNVTLPVGVVGVDDASATVAVLFVLVPAVTVLGEQATPVVVV